MNYWHRCSSHPLSAGRLIYLFFFSQVVYKHFIVVIKIQKYTRLLPSNLLSPTCITQVQAVPGVSEWELKCQYQNALPPGLTLESQREALEVAEQASTISLEDFLGVER